MPTISFRVHGIPRPAGSKRHVGNGVIIDTSGRKGREWRALVQDRCREALGDCAELPAIPQGPVRLEVVFWLQRPNSHYRGKARTLRENAPTCHVSRPDATKLLRAVEDALTGIAWKDDAQVAEQTVCKYYGSAPSCMIDVTRLTR